MSEDLLDEFVAQDLDRRAAILGEAVERAGGRPELRRLIDDRQLEFDARGYATNADALVADVVEKYPEAFGSSGAGVASKPSTMNEMIRQKARGVDLREIKDMNALIRGRAGTKGQPRRADGTFARKS